MKNKKLTFEEVREIQKSLLFSLADFCESHNLRYSLGGGSLLGAVRHQGFIPWDDDVDVMMPRPDYEVLLQEFQHERYYIAHYLASEFHCQTFAKMYDRTVVSHQGASSDSIFIDIFPIDAIVDIEDYQYKKKVEQHYFRIADSYRFFILARNKDNFLSRFTGYIKWVRCLIVYRYFFSYLFTRNFKRGFSLCQSVLTSDDFGNTPLAGAISGLYKEKEIMPTSTFQEYIFLPFERRMISCIKDYDSYLTRHYGDYMQLPPIEKRKGWHQIDYYWKEDYKNDSNRD